MKNNQAQTPYRRLLVTCVAAFAIAVMAAWPQPVSADDILFPPCPRSCKCRRAARRSARGMPSAPRTTSACPQTQASPGPSWGRRPRCSTTMTSKSSPAS
jgi:hypothetical protein